MVCDCAATHTEVVGRRGVVELTHSGAAAYEQWPLPVVLADGGRVKRIETTLGTGDGFLRALVQLGHRCRPTPRSSCLVAARSAAAPDTPPSGLARLSPSSIRAPAREPDWDDGSIRTTWPVWKRQSRGPGASPPPPASQARSPLVRATRAQRALLANLGVEDEFGPGVPSTRALHRKVPVNFALPEPTLLRYLDPTFALSNAAVLQLIRGDIAPGLHNPRPTSSRRSWTSSPRMG